MSKFGFDWDYKKQGEGTMIAILDPKNNFKFTFYSKPTGFECKDHNLYEIPGVVP